MKTTSYPNTITFRVGRFLMFKPPSGRQARAWDALRAGHPEVDGARITQSGAFLNVQVERTMGTGSERIAIVMRLARAFGAPIQVYPSSWDAGTGTVTWVLFTYEGVQVCVETAVCSCHPDAVAS